MFCSSIYISVSSGSAVQSKMFFWNEDVGQLIFFTMKTEVKGQTNSVQMNGRRIPENESKPFSQFPRPLVFTRIMQVYRSKFL